MQEVQMIVSGLRSAGRPPESIQVSPCHDRPFSLQPRHPPRLSQPTSYSNAITILCPLKILQGADKSTFSE